MRRTPALILTLAIAALPSLAEEGRRVAITFDDLPAGAQEGGCDADALLQLNRDLVGSIRRNRVPAVGFVNSGRCQDRPGGMQAALVLWTRAGLILGNHTASHLDLTSTPLD